MFEASRVATTCYIAAETQRPPCEVLCSLSRLPRGLPGHLALRRPGSSLRSFVKPSLGVCADSAVASAAVSVCPVPRAWVLALPAPSVRRRLQPGCRLTGGEQGLWPARVSPHPFLSTPGLPFVLHAGRPLSRAESEEEGGAAEPHQRQRGPLWERLWLPEQSTVTW